MKRRRQALWAASAVVIFSAAYAYPQSAPNKSASQPQASLTHGPSRGSLVLQGGVGPSPAVKSAFVGLAGGAPSHIVVIPTAMVGDAGPPGWVTFLTRRMKEDFGVAEVTVLQSLDRATSDSDHFVEPLRSATGVWIPGGFTERLVYSYIGTNT